jgi:transcriptional regulator with XRE-family HTH domain
MPRSSLKAHRRKVLLALLRDMRLAAGLRQADVAAKLGKPQSFVSNYESGERRLDLLELKMICEVLGVELVDFVARFERGVVPTHERRGDSH